MEDELWTNRGTSDPQCILSSLIRRMRDNLLYKTYTADASAIFLCAQESSIDLRGGVIANVGIFTMTTQIRKDMTSS